MSNIALIDYFLLGALILTTVLIVWGGMTSVKAAIRTGRLQVKGIVYERHAQPLMFWLGVLFWVAISVLMIVFNVFAVLAVFRAAQ
jgi:hypothetical protein